MGDTGLDHAHGEHTGCALQRLGQEEVGQVCTWETEEVETGAHTPSMNSVCLRRHPGGDLKCYPGAPGSGLVRRTDLGTLTIDRTHKHRNEEVAHRRT